jgi:sporulation integral membrane protein YlbJ
MRALPYLQTIFYALAAALMLISCVVYPQGVFQAALRGVAIWWEIILPGLLPFFILSEIVIGVGLVQFLGVILSPFMRTIFGLSGPAAFVVIMGFSTGYPVAAKLSARLREQGLLTRHEGEHLLCFTNLANPLFMYGALAVGFLHHAELGTFIASVHYGTAILIGIGARFVIVNPDQHALLKKKNPISFNEALLQMHRARLTDGRPLGQLLSDAVTQGMGLMMLIGGFIILFSVLNFVLFEIGFTPLIVYLFYPFFLLVGLHPELHVAGFAGLLEMTIGSQLASQTISQSLKEQVALICALISWSGLSIHAQVASVLSQSDLRYRYYFIARVIHSILAYLTVIIVWN